MTRSDRVEHSQRATGAPQLQVLLVDDELEQLLPLADALRHAGITPTIATSDDEAVFDVQASLPDVVVLDAEMADRSLLLRLRALVARLPLVLMICGPACDPQIAAMLAIAGVSCIRKPVDARQLLGLLLSHQPRDATSSERA